MLRMLNMWQILQLTKESDWYNWELKPSTDHYCDWLRLRILSLAHDGSTHVHDILAFFLFRKVKLLNLCPCLPCQVIYKRFNIECPLQVFGNYTADTAIPDDTCTVKFFTINQEVRKINPSLPGTQKNCCILTVILWTVLFREMRYALTTCVIRGYLLMYQLVVVSGSIKILC